MSSSKANADQDLTLSIVVNKTPAEVYAAIKDVKAWWVGDVKGNADEVGSKFSYRYKEYHDSSQRVTELVPNQRVVWHVDDAHIAFTKNKKEWQGTDLVFEIIPKGSETEIKFTHCGLTPAVECYEACSGGWDFYINKSLKNFLLNGKGLDPGF